MAEERDYLLGTHDAEVRRLGHQHRVWRPRVLDAWRRAGIKSGSTVIDAGAGPGWASLDLAEIVGNDGKVIALERSQRFSDIMMSAAAQRGLDDVISPCVMDLVEDPVSFEGVDAVWIRWVLAFVGQPAEVIAKLGVSLRRGGSLVIHEYLNYESFSIVPDDGPIRDFTTQVLDDWRSSGGEPNIGLKLPALLLENGFRIVQMTPLVDVVQPTSFIWQWPASWVRNYPQHLVDTGKVSREWADRVIAALDAAEADQRAIMVTPTVIEIIAEKI